MKKVLMAMVAVAAVAMAGVSWAASTTPLTVNANVVGTCKFTGGNPPLAFGDLDPSQDTLKQASVDVQFWCTKGSAAAPTFSAGNGNNFAGSTRNMVGPGGDIIPYSIDSFTADGNPNTGPGTPRMVTILGTVPANSYSDKTFGAYSDTVTLTITP